MMENQKHLFNLPENIHYLNGAYMSPSLNCVTAAGIEGVKLKGNPISLTESDFFEPAHDLKVLFGQLINGVATQIAIIPSASYGLMNAISNVPHENNQHALVVTEEFPSDHLTVQNWCKQHNAQLKIIGNPPVKKGKAQEWTEQIVNTITEQTAMLVMSSIHWMDGTIFDLEAIGKKCQQTNTYFIVDGTQSVGAMAIDVRKYKIDALICAGYKWLMGPYSLGLAYYSEKFNTGKPIEESWMNRREASDFSKLTTYPETYGEGAQRYNVGEFSNFISLPMLKAALEQIIEWDPKNIQAYCGNLVAPIYSFLEEHNIPSDNANAISSHLVGIYLPQTVDMNFFMQSLKAQQIFVSARGRSIRVSPHVYNTESDIDAFLTVFKNHI